MKGSEHQTILARKYVERSNQHNLNAILPMFDDNATYNSSQAGSYAGKKAIGEMMGQFFALFPDVSWKATSYRAVEDRSIEFSFLMHAKNNQTGESITRQGIERLIFTLDNLISHIEVSAQSA
jgi:hypothetical protein